MSATHDPLLEKIRETLRAEAEGLDGRTADRLGDIRRNALSQREGLFPRAAAAAASFRFRAVLAGGLAAAAVLVALKLDSPPPQQRFAADAPMAQIEILASDQELDFYRELEFAAWLAER